MNNSKLTKDLLNELFEYKDGNIFWKVARKNGIDITKPAGSIKKDNYIHVVIFGKSYLMHRIIFLMFNGYMPNQVDHIDNNRLNNNINNLRASTHAQNQQNTKKYANNTSGYKGVTFHKPNKKWLAQIRFDGNKIYLSASSCLSCALFSFANLYSVW